MDAALAPGNHETRMQVENLRRHSIADIESDLAPDETADDFRRARGARRKRPLRTALPRPAKTPRRDQSG